MEQRYLQKLLNEETFQEIATLSCRVDIPSLTVDVGIDSFWIQKETAYFAVVNFETVTKFNGQPMFIS